MALTALSIIDPLVGVVAIGCAAAVSRQRNTRIALLLGATGICWFLGSIFPPLVFPHRGPLIQLILTYPSGRIRRPFTAVAVVAGYLGGVAAGLYPSPWVTLLTAVLVALASIDGYLRATGHLRKAALPALIAGLAFAAALILGSVGQLLRWEADLLIATVYDVTVIAVMLGLTLALRFSRWTESAVADLVTQIGGSDPAGVTRELRRALGDPALIVGYWSAAEQSYLDAGGGMIDTDRLRGRVATPITDNAKPIAILLHDATLTADSTLIAGSSAIVRIAVANAQMRAEVQDRASRLARARRSIIQAADDERRSLEARVVSGPERHLAVVEAHLSSLDGSQDAALRSILLPVRDELAAARSELRQFVHGIRPSDLGSGGLTLAVPALAIRAGLPVDVQVAVDHLDPEVESAVYFLCSEALTNIAKHSGATVASIHVTDDAADVIVRIADNGRGGADPRGTGLRGISDRIQALGGTMSVHDGAERGTELLARVPGGSRS